MMRTTRPGRPPILTTKRLDLLPLDSERDAHSLHAMFGDSEHDQFGYEPPSRDVSETRARLDSALAKNGGWTWAIRFHQDPNAIGIVGLFEDQGGPIRGLSWDLTRRYWGQGLMSEAARAAVDRLLDEPGITGVEAWIDTRNIRSIGVARRAGLAESARMARVYADHTAQQVVMSRAAEPCDPDVVAVRVNLEVTDIRAMTTALIDVFGLRLAFEYGDPPTMARLAISPWTGCSSIDLRQASGEITPSAAALEIGLPTDVIYQRATQAGLSVPRPPQDEPWHRRTVTVQLPDGHRITADGPLRPARTIDQE